MKNVTQLEVRGAKDCLTLLENALRNAGIGLKETAADYDDSSLIIQFEMTKVFFFSPEMYTEMFTRTNEPRPLSHSFKYRQRSPDVLSKTYVDIVNSQN